MIDYTMLLSLEEVIVASCALNYIHRTPLLATCFLSIEHAI